MKFPNICFENAQTLKESAFLFPCEREAATYFTLSNGYMGIRGSLEESNGVDVQGAFIRGVIGYCPCNPKPLTENDYMKKWYFDEDAIRTYDTGITNVNFADPLFVRITVNGEVFYPWEGEILSWERALDMENAILTRTVRWQNSKGDIVRLNFERFVSYDNDHLMCQKITVTPENFSGTVLLESGVDSITKSDGWKLTCNGSSAIVGNRVNYACDSCEKLPFRIAVSAQSEIVGHNADFTPVEQNGIFAVGTELSLQSGESVTLVKKVFVITARDGVSDPEKAAQEADLSAEYDTLKTAHIRAFKKAFAKLDITVEGDDKADTALRFNNFHTLGTINRNDSVHSLAPKGLTGYCYTGMVWWDCEVYQSPVFYETMPECGRNLLLYRYRMLEQARKNAIAEGRKGARYPFNSGISGKELVWPVSRHPIMQIHIVSDVAWSINNYYNCTGDDDFMIEYGMEMLFEICRYWLSRVEKDERGYVIMQVTGTDEQHPYVDNNAYTNYCVRYLLDRTLMFCEKYGDKLNAVKTKVALQADELTAFADLAKNLYLPMVKETGMIPQFDGYFELNRELEYSNGGKNVLANFQISSGLYHKSQVIKQPDVLVMFAYQNFKFDPQVYRRNWDYYRARCEALSSLSFCVHSICASDNGAVESAYADFMRTALIDLDDLHNCAFQGIHAACAAGAWMSVVRGIAGAKMSAEEVTVNPSMIPWWKRVSFSLCWHGQNFTVELTNETVKVTASDENKGVLVLELCGERLSLAAGQSAEKVLSLTENSQCLF
ncbi:MAG: hypothetical protein MJ132_01705 [Clostridia bacterium]|nr:hypothetical protein [Clostridia bacterium]